MFAWRFSSERGKGLIGMLLVVIIISVVMNLYLKSLTNDNTEDGMTKIAPKKTIEKARSAGAVAEISNLKSAIEVYKIDHEGKLPSSLDELVAGNYASEASVTDDYGDKYLYDPSTGNIHQ